MNDKDTRRQRAILIINILIVVASICALTLFLYPTIANRINQVTQDRDIVVYNTVVQDLDVSALDSMWADAKAFNNEIAGREVLFQLTDDESAAYNGLLNAGGDGLMAYIDIPAQNIHLPVYHGTEDEVLERAVGHLEGTSLPTDGDSVHVIITGHTGLPSLDLFTDIREMAVGDTYTITTLNRVLTYTVDQIDTVLPEELYNLRIIDGENYCTLVTCTPYGINDHRLLVRGTLTGVTETGTTQESQESYVMSDSYKAVDDLVLTIGVIVAAIVAVLLLVVVVGYVRLRRR